MFLLLKDDTEKVKITNDSSMVENEYILAL